MVSFLPSKEWIGRNVFVPVQIKISRNELRGYIAMSSTSSLFFLERKVYAGVKKWHGCKLSLQFRVEPVRKAYRLEHGLSYSLTSV